ncbi:hypothetical protein [Brevundimonas sp.]|uniref:hypothetical protein n=1 Tax=Brevundimonas sp. TaxID=1871086 RepID=UPI002FC951E6
MTIRISYTTASIALALAGGLILSSCDNSYDQHDSAVMEVEQVEDAAPAAEEAATPVVAETPQAAPDTAPTETLPPAVQSSEESVQPESETLFY